MAQRILVVLTALRLLSRGPAVDAAMPLEAAADVPWENLEAQLTDPSLLTSTNVTEWATQCLDPFVGEFGVPPFGMGNAAVISNYQLVNQSSGLCLDHVSCAYQNCFWPFVEPATSPFPLDTSPYAAFGLDWRKDGSLYEDRLNLPVMVLQPATVADVVAAITFCRVHQIGITVKVAGHSYFGASTARGTLLLNLSTNYPKYASSGSLTECVDDISMNNNDTTAPSATTMACALAVARGKKAVLRVGGGEIFDEAYRAVSFDWNSENVDNKYHLVGGGAGTVSAAGGWMASGGLSGTTGMRSYGLGIDQVLHLEMVLPNGQHVRFGPSAWEEVSNENDEAFLYPKSTAITGYCNANPMAANESQWDWIACDDDEDINFDDLWFAVRGGGGGTYGLVTSLHYQLHDYPGMLQLVSEDPTNVLAYEDWTDNSAFVFTNVYVSFFLQFLYVPVLLNVTESESNLCSSAQTFNLSPFGGGILFCYGASGTTVVAKYQEYMQSDEIVRTLQEAGLPEDIIASLSTIISVAAETESYAAVVVSTDESSGVPAGRLMDNPKASLIPLLGGYPSYVDSTHTHIPLHVVRNNLAQVVNTVALDVLLFPGTGTIYAMGGVIPYAHDQTTSLSETRRTAALLKAVPDEGIRDEYYKLIFGSANMTGDFPGASCHNHAQIYEMGPLKNNWTKTCPLEWPQSEREAQCISQGESFWGSSNFARLEQIKAAIDPYSLFVCAGGVGYSEDSPDEVVGTADAPTSSPTPSSSSTMDRPRIYAMLWCAGLITAF